LFPHLSIPWLLAGRCYSKPEPLRRQEDDQQAELRRLRAELKRVTEERDILKNRLPGAPRPIGLETRPLH